MNKFYFLLLVAVFQPFFVTAQSFEESKLSERLLRQAQDSPGEKQLVYILLEDQLDVETMGKSFEKNGIPVTERVPILIESLKEKADKTQPTFINYLSTLDGIDPSSIRPYWITNVLFVEANASAIAELSNRTDVSWMDMNVENAISENETIDCAMPPALNGTEPGLRAINAPALWAMGYTGYGQIGFTADTGIDPWHPAISLKYRGLYADNSETWVSFNVIGNVTNNTTPSNCGDHGNHTAGTMLGLDRMNNDTIGVAYGANWIGSAILCGIGTADNIGALQWALNPDGNINTIEDMPDVINNSWRDGGFAGGQDCNSVYNSVLTALEVAGVATIFSAGNEGPEPMTITAPHNINTDTFNTFTVGALNANGFTPFIADFSSRGPSFCSGVGSLLIKPEVSAPGDDVRSCNLDGTYGTKSGTSMAAPHVAGAVMLIKEAFPYLPGKDILRAIYHTCTDLGEPGEDNDYGMGMIDVLAAYNLLVDQGFTPVSPHVEHDALLVGFAGTEETCLEVFTDEVFFENAGTENLTSLDLSFTLTRTDAPGPNLSGTVSWTGDLATRERASIVIPGQTLVNGTYQLEVTLSNPNGTADQKPLNNRGIRRFELYISDDYNVFLGGFEDTAPCEGSKAILFSDYEGDGTIRWFSSLTSDIPKGEGNFFTTKVLNTNTTYYTDIIHPSFTGEEELDQQTIASDTQDGGLLISVDVPFTLKSVKVYPTSTGTRFLQLRSFAGELIESVPLQLFEPIEQRIEVNLEVPVGNWFITLGDMGFSLPYSNTANYPYPIGDDLGEIVRSNNLAAPFDVWYYFYDWEVVNPNLCTRKSIDIEVQSSGSTPTALFTSSADIVDFLDNEAVQFTNESEEAVEWMWTFGDGDSSDEENPSHLYEQEGIYTIVLTALGADGCSDSYSKVVEVKNLGTTSISSLELKGNVNLYPNPVKDILHIKYDFEELQFLDLKIMDALGRTVHVVPNRSYQRGEELINTEGWPNGLYYMVLTNGKASLAKKVVRLN